MALLGVSLAHGRCKFRLDEASASSLLQASLGGTAAHFRVSFLANRTFKFFVSSRRVGFLIADLGSFSCDSFHVTFHLWGNGGPNWRKELRAFEFEEACSWQPAPATSSKASTARSFADVVRSGPKAIVSGANAVPLGRRSVFLRLRDAQGRLSPATQSPKAPSHGGRSFHAGQPRSRPSMQRGNHANPFCPRCLSSGHVRSACKNPFKCRACLKWGHAEVNCWVNRAVKAGPSKEISKNLQQTAGWGGHCGVAGPSCNPPPDSSGFPGRPAPGSKAWAVKKTAPGQPTTVHHAGHSVLTEISVRVFRVFFNSVF